MSHVIWYDLYLYLLSSGDDYWRRFVCVYWTVDRVWIFFVRIGGVAVCIVYYSKFALFCVD